MKLHPVFMTLMAINLASIPMVGWAGNYYVSGGQAMTVSDQSLITDLTSATPLDLEALPASFSGKYSVVLVKDTDSVLNLNAINPSSPFDLSTANCQSPIKTCAQMAVTPNTLYLVAVNQGGKAHISSQGNPWVIEAGAFSLGVFYDQASDYRGGGGSLLSIDNIEYRLSEGAVNAIQDGAYGVPIGPGKLKAIDAAFVPNITIKNSTIGAMASVGFFSQSDVWIENSTLEVGSLSCSGICAGIQLLNRNARVQGDQVTLNGKNYGIYYGESGSNAGDGVFGTVSLSHSSIKTTGAGTSVSPIAGVYVQTGVLTTDALIESLHLSQSSILTQGNYSYGTYSKYTNMTIDQSRIETKGVSSWGIYHFGHGYYSVINGSAVKTIGNGAYGVVVETSATDSTTARNGPIEFILSNSSITTEGQNAKGMIASNVFVSGVGTRSPATIRVTDSTLLTRGDNADIFNVQLGATLNVQGLDARSEGNEAEFLWMRHGGNVSITDAQVSLTGGSSHLLWLDPYLTNSLYTNQVSLKDSVLSTKNGYGIIIRGGNQTNLVFDHVQLNPSTLDTPDEQVLLFASNIPSYNLSPKDINITATQGSILNGAVMLYDESHIASISLDQSRLYGRIDLSDNSQFDALTLKNNSLWQGVANSSTPSSLHIQQLAIDASSKWQLNGNDTVGRDSVVGSVSNKGSIDFIWGGVPGEYQSLTIYGDYTGGGVLRMSGEYASYDGDSPRDTLTIKGNVLDHSLTKVYFQSNDNLGAQTQGDGIRVIAVEGTGAYTDSFIQGGNLYAGLYSYQLRAGKADGTFDQTWYLVSELTPTPPPPGPKPPDPTEPTEPPDPIVPPPEPPPAIIEPPAVTYRPEVIVSNILPALGYASGLAQIGTYQERIAGTDNSIEGKGGWFRSFVNKADIRYDHQSSNASRLQRFERSGAAYDRELVGFQFGYDIQRSGASQTNEFVIDPLVRSGVFLGLGSINSDVLGVYDDKEIGSVSLKHLSLGAYYTKQDGQGWYSDNVFGLNLLYGIKLAYEDPILTPSTTHGMGLFMSTEFGYKYALSPGFFIEPQAQLLYQHINIDDVRLAPDLQVTYDNANALSARLGVRLAQQLSDDPKQVAYVRFNVLNSYGSRATMTYTNPRMGDSTARNVGNEMHGAWAQIDLGINKKIGVSSYGYLAFDYSEGLGSSTGRQANIKLGVTSSF